MKEEKVWSSGNFFFYYLSWLWHYLKFILVYFERKEKFVVLSGHPISFFGMSIQKFLRPSILFAYWIGDYFPSVNLSLRLFEKLKKYYHNRVSYAYYLSDTINQIFNDGKVVDNERKKTVMWGVKPIITKKRDVKGQLHILFVGLVKEGQGLEVLLSFLAKHPDYTLKIIGICREELFKKYQALIAKHKIGDRVFFPNKFYSDTELESIAKDCHVGVALYDTGKLNATHYTDPGKVKTYAELGLPIIMTNTSAIASYIKKFHAGEVIEEASDMPIAVEKIKKDYDHYQTGLCLFARHFEYEKYYRLAFVALERR